MNKQEWNKLPYYKRAWLLGLVMEHMNHEGAYYESGWLYIWPDGESYQDCMYDFEKKEDYKDLEESFKRIYKYKPYHNGGLYSFKSVPQEVIDVAHFWDEELGLPPIEVIK